MARVTSDWTIQRYLEEQYALQRAITDSTEYLMGVSIACFSRYLGRDARLEDLTEFAVSRYVRELEQRYKPKTVHGRRGDLLALWRHAADAGIVDPPGKVRVVKVPEPNPVAWTPAEMAAILKQCQQTAGFLRNGVPRRLYFSALFRVAYETGLRRSDLLRIRTTDVDANGTVVILQQKTQRAHTCAMRPETAQLLREITDRLKRDQDQHAATPLRWPYTPRQLYGWIEKITTAAGVRRGALQQARRTGATHAERELPGTAARYLGHSSDSQARKHYIDRSQAYGPVRPPQIDDAS